MKTRILSLVLIAIFAISTTAMAQEQKTKKGDSEKKEMMMKKHRPDMKDRFDNFFTEEQQEKMKELRLETAKQVKPLKNQLNELKAKEQTLTTADKADLNAIYKNIDKMSSIKADIMKIMAKQHQEVRAMLSEEQLIKFDMMKEKRGKRHAENKGGEEMHRGGDRPTERGA
jgi:Spy/CpxP family protein refolding chaperone